MATERMLGLPDHLRRSDFRLAVRLTHLAPVNVVAKMTYRSGSGLEKCRLLYIVGKLGRGGAERQLAYLLQAMNRQRYKPAVVVWDYSPDDALTQEIEARGIPIYSFPTGVSRATKLREVRRLARQLEPEVIHSYFFYTNFAAYWAALGTNAIAIGSLRGDFSQHKKDGGLCIGCLSARWPRQQISNSFASAEKALSSRGVFYPKQVFVVRNGVDLERFSTVNGIDVSKAYIAGLGSLIPLKRWDRVLGIVQQVNRKGGTCKVRIAGDGPERVSLERQAEDLGISECVQFVGPINDVPDFFDKARFVLHTSDSEGTPNSVMEAMACGRAVVAMDAGDIRLLVENGKTGFVIRRGDEATFAGRVLQLLSDDELCSRMGQAARAKAEQEFALGRLVYETLNAYRAAGWRARTH
jgi:glycosyltransferase involved in cell wall biosynthesis